jgi:glutaredoxin 3
MKNFFTVYILTDCPFCKKAISLLDEKNIPFVVVVMDKNEEFLQKIKQDTNHPTVPIVVYQTQLITRLIGGCDNLETFLHSQEFLND